MTDKARELLEWALECWELQMAGVANRGFNPFEEIRDYLAEPEVKREALSDEEILKGWSVASLYGHVDRATLYGHVDRATFISGVRFAEKHHGIGGGDE